MAKGLYGQNQGNENRIGTAVQADHFHANQVVEGTEVAVLNRMATEHDWKALTAYCSLLKDRGHAQYRIDAMLNQAMYGVRL